MCALACVYNKDNTRTFVAVTPSLWSCFEPNVFDVVAILCNTLQVMIIATISAGQVPRSFVSLLRAYDGICYGV